MSKYELVDIKADAWKKLNDLNLSYKNMAAGMTRQQKQHYMKIYHVYIFEKIRAIDYLLLCDEDFDITYFKNNFSSDIFNDLDIMKYGVLLHPSIICFAGTDVKKNKEIGISVVKEDASLLEHLDDDLKDNESIIMEATLNYSFDRFNSKTAFIYASDNLKKKKEFILKLVKFVPEIYEYIDETLKNDLDIIIETCSNDVSQLEHVPKDIRDNKDSVKRIIYANKNNLYRMDLYVSSDILNEIIVELIDEDKLNIVHLSFRQIDFICTYYSKEVLNKLIEFYKQNRRYNNVNHDIEISYFDSKVNGAERKRFKNHN